jgi:hypothetical protein
VLAEDESSSEESLPMPIEEVEVPVRKKERSGSAFWPKREVSLLPVGAPPIEKFRRVVRAVIAAKRVKRLNDEEKKRRAAMAQKKSRRDREGRRSALRSLENAADYKSKFVALKVVGAARPVMGDFQRNDDGGDGDDDASLGNNGESDENEH